MDLGQIEVTTDSTQFIHGPNISSAAYIADTVFAFCPLTRTFPAGTATHVFFPSNFYGNLPWGLPLEFDPGDGLGFRNIQLGDSLEIDYSGLDTALLELRYTNNGHTYRAYSKVAISPPQRPALGNGSEPCVFTEVEGVSIEVAFADPDCESTHFANALIVVDGIDPTILQNVQFADAFEKYSGFQLPSGEAVAEIIADRGYDFIFINFDDGGQSVEATAQLLKESIRWINAQKAITGTRGDNIVIGHSMGGLTSKWALAEMADAQEDHGVSKLIIFDSPLRGAVIPYGMQAMLQYLINFTIQAQDGEPITLGDLETLQAADAALNTTAARELLINSVDAAGYVELRGRPWNSYGEAWSRFRANPEIHDAFQADFDALPALDVPHYAIADGARNFDQLTGTTDAGDKITHNGLIASLSIDSDKCENPNEVWGNCSTIKTANFELNATARYSPGGLEVSPRLRFYWNGITVMRSPNHTGSTNHSSQGLVNYDLAPGCLGDDGISQLRDAPMTPQEPGTSLGVTMHNDHYAFVPTSSALNLPISISASVLGCGSGIAECGTPENSRIVGRTFVTPTANHEHVTFTTSIANFLLDKIPAIGSDVWINTSGSSVLNEEYNFGFDLLTNDATPNVISGTQTVSGNGAYLINQDKRIRYVNDPANPPATTADFTVYIGGLPCREGTGVVTLQAGGHIRVGQDGDKRGDLVVGGMASLIIRSGGFTSVNSGSKVLVASDGTDGEGGLVIENGGFIDARYSGQVIADGGTIRIESGGQLRTSFSGQIIARNGGKIILEDGALVQLWSDSDPEGKGTVWIQEGGELVIEGEYVYSGSGYWQFDKGNTVSGDGNLVIEGDGREFRRMKVNNSANVLLNKGQGFEVSNAKVVYGNSSSVSVLEGSSFDVNNASFVGPAAPAIYTDASARSSVDNSEFLGNEQGILLDRKGSLSALYINSSLFQSSTIAGVTFEGWASDNFGRTPNINGCTFIGCQTGVRIDDFVAANISTSTFASSEENQFAINAEFCQNLYVRECTVNGYDTQLNGTDKKGAVELEFVTARFSGGAYSANTIAIHDQGGSTITFNNCVDVIGNCYGIANSEAVGDITTLALNGMSLLNNTIGIYGGSGNITSSGINSFQMGTAAAAKSCEVAISRLIDMDVDQMANPSITLNGNHWMDAQGDALTQPPVPNDWFCIRNLPSNGCNATFTIPTNNIQPQGCGSGPCESPKTCDYYCQLYPEDPACFGGGGSGLPGFTANPNPSGGFVALSQLPEDGGTLNVYDARGALMKVILLDEATHQIVNLNDLPSGIYTLQLIDQQTTENSLVRVMLSK